jgi:hypothetical protein
VWFQSKRGEMKWKVILEGDDECQSVMCFDFAVGLLTPPKPKKKEYGVRLPAKETHKKFDGSEFLVVHCFTISVPQKPYYYYYYYYHYHYYYYYYYYYYY